MKPYLILILLVALAFANSIQNSFVWDDHDLVLGNPRINPSLKEIPLVFTTPMWKLAGFSEYRQIYYRPVDHLFAVLKYKVWGLNPSGFHLTDILLHIMSVIFLYRVGLLLFNNDKLISLMAATIFAVHPVHNESVGRTTLGEVIFGFFIILTVYLFLKERKYLSLLAFFLALLSKESAVMLPFALIILAIHKEGIKKSLTAIIPYMILVGVYLIIRLQVVDTVFGDTVAQPLSTRVFTMAVATFDYIRLLIIPYPLSPFYPARWYTSIFEPKVLLAIVVLALIFYLIFRMRRDKTMLFLLSFPFIMLIPVIWRVSTFPIGEEFVYIAERFLYVPAMASSLFISAFAVKFFRAKARVYLIIGWLSLALIFVAITIASNRMWKNDIALLEKIIEGAPYAAFAHNNLGLAYYNQGRLTEAIHEYLSALKIKPDDAITHYNLGLAYGKGGRLNEAIQEFLTTLRLKPDYPKAHNGLGLAYYNQGRLDEAIHEYKTAARLKPDYAEAHSNLGFVYYKQGRVNEAIQEYTAALKLNPKLADVHNNLGLAYKQKGLIDEAIQEFKEALRLKPDLIQARQNLESL